MDKDANCNGREERRFEVDDPSGNCLNKKKQGEGASFHSKQPVESRDQGGGKKPNKAKIRKDAG